MLVYVMVRFRGGSCLLQTLKRSQTGADDALASIIAAPPQPRPYRFCTKPSSLEIAGRAGQHVSTLLGLVEAGLGVAVVPRLSMPQGEHANLAKVALVEPTIDRNVGLIRRQGRELSPSARKLYELIESTWALGNGHASS